MKCVFFLLTLVVVVRLSQVGAGLGDSKSYRTNRIRRQAVVLPVAVKPAYTCFKITPEVVGELQTKHGLPNMSVLHFDTENGRKDVFNKSSDVEVFYIYGEPVQNGSANILDRFEMVAPGDAPSNLTFGGLEYPKFTDRNCTQLVGGDIPVMDAADKKILAALTLTTKRLSHSVEKTKYGNQLRTGYMNLVQTESVIRMQANDSDTTLPTVWLFFVNSTVANTSDPTTLATGGTTVPTAGPNDNTTPSSSDIKSPSSSGFPFWIVILIVAVVLLGAGLVFYVLRKPRVQSRSQSRLPADRLTL